MIFLAPEAADEIARLHANGWLRTEAADDCWNIQAMHLGELPWPQLVI
jgi:hypothetical protein